ncbi:MAG: SHOCT domain-containing protein [bacterium]|nr:SHOCT domain-containing protein [bacterium]
MMWWYGPSGWMGATGFIFMILFWILVTISVIYLIRYLADQSRESPGQKTPLQILQERYAKGEIDKKEYEGKKKDLS